LPIFGVAAALLVGRRSIKDILPPRALQQHQISGNAPVPHFDMGSQTKAAGYRRAARRLDQLSLFGFRYGTWMM
jgi:hypothetical protein